MSTERKGLLHLTENHDGEEIAQDNFPQPISNPTRIEGMNFEEITSYLSQVGLKNIPSETGARGLIHWLENARKGVPNLENAQKYYKDRVTRLRQLEERFVGKTINLPNSKTAYTCLAVTTYGRNNPDPVLLFDLNGTEKVFIKLNDRRLTTIV